LFSKSFYPLITLEALLQGLILEQLRNSACDLVSTLNGNNTKPLKAIKSASETTSAVWINLGFLAAKSSVALSVGLIKPFKILQWVY